MCRWIGSRDASLSTRTPRRSGEAGFTLLEVLVAFAVLAVMIVPILQVFGGGLGATETARAYSTAALLARSKLAEVGAGGALDEGETTGAVEGYQWRRTISRTELTAAEADDRDRPDAKGSRKQRRESRLFGDRESGRQGRSSFGEGGSGFGERQGSFGESRSGFGDGRSSFGRSMSSPAGRPALSGGQGTATGNAGGPQSEDLIPYEVTVTVEWGTRASGGTLSLSTLRLSRQNAGVEAGAQ